MGEGGRRKYITGILLTCGLNGRRVIDFTDEKGRMGMSLSLASTSYTVIDAIVLSASRNFS